MFFFVEIYAQLNKHLPPNEHHHDRLIGRRKYIGSKCYNILFPQTKVKSKDTNEAKEERVNTSSREVESMLKKARVFAYFKAASPQTASKFSSEAGEREKQHNEME